MIEGHGDDLYLYSHPIVSNFSSNVYNGYDHSGLFRHLKNRLSTIHSYPEPAPRTLERLIARKHSLGSPAQVCVTNGATEGIYLIAQTFREKTSAIRMPAFSEYADACRMHNHRIKPFFNPDEAPKETDLIWIGNPNNPTGEVYDRERVRQALRERPECLFVFDHSYEHFTRRPLLSPEEAVQCSNVILIHSMTKQYAIPGLRIGYLTACETLMKKIRACKMPWSVNALAIEAARYLLENEPDSLPDTDKLLEERERFVGLLNGMTELQCLPTDTHYLLIRLHKGTASELKNYLAKNRGILIRDASNFEGLDERFFRIAIQTPPENDRLAEALQAWLYTDISFTPHCTSAP